MKKYGVLIADDSALMRRILKRIIDEDSSLYVLDTARDGNDAVAKAKALRPQVISMDINMPGIDGITALQIIMEEQICPVVMVSSLTQESALPTFESLELGAFDFVGKPGGTVSLDMGSVSRELVMKLKTAAKAGLKSQLPARSKQQRVTTLRKPRSGLRRSSSRRTLAMEHKAIAIGISTGGPKVIFEMLRELPPDLNAAIFLVQHMPPGGFTATFAERLNRHSPIPFVEAKPGMVIEPGQGYLGKGGYHMKLFRQSDGNTVIRCSSSPHHQFMPSVDVMMESVLSIYGDRTVGVLMTGIGDDGADSLVKIREAGGMTIAESEESAIVFGMPQQAIKRGGAEVVAPLWDIADEIVNAVES